MHSKFTKPTLGFRGLLIFGLVRLLHKVVHSIIPLFGVREKPIHEIAGAASAVSFTLILQFGLQMVEPEANSTKAVCWPTYWTALPDDRHILTEIGVFGGRMYTHFIYLFINFSFGGCST